VIPLPFVGCTLPTFERYIRRLLTLPPGVPCRSLRQFALRLGCRYACGCLDCCGRLVVTRLHHTANGALPPACLPSRWTVVSCHRLPHLHRPFGLLPVWCLTVAGYLPHLTTYHSCCDGAAPIPRRAFFVCVDYTLPATHHPHTPTPHHDLPPALYVSPTRWTLDGCSLIGGTFTPVLLFDCHALTGHLGLLLNKLLPAAYLTHYLTDATAYYSVGRTFAHLERATC